MRVKRINWVRYLVLTGVALILSITAGGAFASPRSSQYDVPGQNEPAKVVKVAVLASKSTVSPKATKEASPQATTAETLPFTGVDLVLIVGLGGVLVGGGLALRAAGRKHTEIS